MEYQQNLGDDMSTTHDVQYCVLIYLPEAKQPDVDSVVAKIREIDSLVPWGDGVVEIQYDKYVRHTTVSTAEGHVAARVHCFEVTPSDAPMSLERAFEYNEDHVNQLRDYLEGGECPFPDAIMAKVSIGIQLV